MRSPAPTRYRRSAHESRKSKKQLEQKADTFSEKARELGGKAASGATKGAKAISGIAQDGQHKLRMNYYNPLFPEEYASPDFDLPMMIVIEDEDGRKGIDISEGAIGWLSKGWLGSSPSIQRSR